MSPFVFPIHSFYDINGRPLVGGRLYSFETNSDTPQATYTNPEGTEYNENPIVLNERGECRVYIDDTKLYRFVLRDALGNTIWSIDNISSAYPGSGEGSSVSVDGTTDQIKVTSSVVGGVKHFIVGLSGTVTAFFSFLMNSINQLNSAMAYKKDKQNPLSFVGSAAQTVTRISQDANGKLDVDFGNIEKQTAYVTTDSTWFDVDNAYNNGQIVCLHHSGRFYTLQRTDMVGGVLQYVFYAFPDEVNESGDPSKIDSYSVKFMRCRLGSDDSTVWEEVYSTAGADEKKVYSAYKTDQLLATKTPILGWTRGIGDWSEQNLRWYKICEAPAPSVGADLYSTTFEIVCGTDYNGKALDSGVFEVSVYGDKVQGRWLTYTAPGIDKYHINRVSVTVNTKLEVFVEMRDFSNLTFMATALSNTGMIANRSVFTYENGRVYETTAPYGSISHFPTAPSLPSTVMDADEIVLSRWYAYDSIQNSMDENKPVVVRVASKDKSYLITSRDVSGTTKYFYGVAFDNANTDFEVLRLEYDADLHYTWTYSFITKVCESKAKGQLFVFDESEFQGSVDAKRALFANIANAMKNNGTVIMQEYGDYISTDIGQYEEWAQWHLVSYRELASGKNVLVFDKGFEYIAGGKIQFTRKTVEYIRSTATISQQDIDYPVDVSY